MNAAWPDGIIARYLTIGGATVDITPNTDGTYQLTCTGGWCSFSGTTTGFLGTDNQPDPKTAPGRARSAAQDHARTCRAMPNPAEAGR